jgi:hypothetical protein
MRSIVYFRPTAPPGRPVIAAFIVSALVSAAAARKAEAVAIEVPKESDWTVIVRGFIAADMNWDQHDLGAAEPFFPPPNDSAQASNRALRFSASQSQIGFYVAPPRQDNFSTDAYLEMDFLKGPITGPDEHLVSATPRLRLAYGRFRWNDDNDTLIAGQTYILFGDLYPDLTWDNLSLSLGAVIGREPQVQYTHVAAINSDSKMTFAASVNAPNSGLFNEATNAAETSGSPYVHAKIGYETEALGKADYYGFEKHPDVPAEIALSAFYGREKIPRVALGGNQDVDAWGIALNGVLPIVGIRNNHRAGAASIEAQVWIGEHVDSYFGGNGQGVYETDNGRVAGIKAHGGFVEGKYFFTQKLNITAEYSLDNNNLNDLTDARVPFRIASGLFSDTTFGSPGINKARDIDVALWYNPLAPAFFGLVWDSRKAKYNNGVTGSSNRINLSMFYNF